MWQEKPTRQTYDYQQAEHRRTLNLVLMMASHYSEPLLIHGVRSSWITAATSFDIPTEFRDLSMP